MALADGGATSAAAIRNLGDGRGKFRAHANAIAWRLAVLTLLLQRLALGVLTLWVVSVLIFAGTEILPGDVAGAILGQSRTPETEAAIRASLGLDRPAPVRYVEWLRDFTSGKIGKSLTRFGQDITQEIHQRLANTIFLASVAACISVPLALLLGLLAAMKQNSFFDRMVNAVSLLAISVPEFFIGYILIIFISVKLTLFPSLAMVSDDMSLGDRLYTVALPALTLVLAVLAHMMRQTRAAVLSVLTSPYIETAILKGIPNWRIVVQHALPNAIAPIVTVVAVNLAYLVVGVVVVEVVFVYPGMGQLMVDAVSKRDMPVVQTCGLIFASAYVVLNMIADLIGILSNPRLRHPR